MEQRTCSDCGESKPQNEFRLRESGRSRRPYCLACEKARKRAHYLSTKAVVRERDARWRAANPERDRAYRQRWIEENRERVRAYKAAYRQRQRDPEVVARRTARETLLADGKKLCTKCGKIKKLSDFDRRGAPKRHLYKSHCHECILAASREGGYRKLTVRSSTGRKRKILAAFVEHVDRYKVYERDGGVCGLCGEWVDPLEFHVDHIVPVAAGGEHSYANVQLAHPRCNRRKGRRMTTVS